MSRISCGQANPFEFPKISWAIRTKIEIIFVASTEFSYLLKIFSIWIDMETLPLYNLHIDPSLAILFFVKLKEEPQ